MKKDFLCDTKMFMIDNKLAMDFVIKKENLEDDIKTVCDNVGIKFDKDRILGFKTHYRNKNIKSYRDYYTDEEIEIVKNCFNAEISLFSYEF